MPSEPTPTEKSGAPLSPERWRRIKDVFSHAVELEGAAREAFLREACGDDEELRSRVLAMLATDAEPATFLERPVAGLPRQLIPKDLEESPIGRRIGRHRVVREIERGGMGAVYLAVRDDDQYQEQVAIKLIKRGMDTDSVVERFRQERQILANLDHPNIARLLDGGVTEEGLPYFVMEYIEGVPIDRYCDEARLPLTERLRLLRQVCAAVHYAHRNLVVHRDLKPSNILVTTDGVPKLLDFGIAKLLGAEVRDDAAVPSATLTGQRPMTPEYASPEQVQGGAVTTASDAYSLGIVLYQLLAGRRPYRLDSRSAAEAERVILTVEPERPSTLDLQPDVATARGTTVERLHRQLQGDLDNIALKALRKEPERRYGTAEQLSEDLRRYLEGLPVTARQDTFAYRTGKFVRRHKVGVLASLLVVLSLVGGITATAWQAQVARRAQGQAENALEQAESERATAEEVTAFMVQLFADAAPNKSGASEITVRELLARGVERIGSSFEDRPQLQARLLIEIGEVYQELGLFDEAEQLLSRSLLARRRLFGERHPAVAESLNSLGVLYREAGNLGKAEEMLRAALDQRLALFGEDSLEVAESLNNLGTALSAKGELETAEELLRKALDLNRRLLGERNENVARTLINLAGTLRARRDLEGAEALYREALDLNEQLHGEDFPQYARGLFHLATVLFEQGKNEAAEPLFRRALELNRRVFGEENAEVSSCLYSLGVLRHVAGDHEAAEPLYRQALALDRQLLGSEHDTVALRLASLGKLRVAQGDPEEAEALLRESLAIRQRLLPEDHWKVAYVRSELAGALLARRRYDEAEALLRPAFEVFRQTVGPDHRYTREAAGRLIEIYEAPGRPAVTWPDGLGDLR